MNRIKLERYNHQFAILISEILQNEVKDDDIQFVTVTDCDITSDLSFCKVYVTVFDQDKKESTLKALNNAASFIRGKLSQEIEIRHTPELKFLYDDSIEYGYRIEQKVEEIRAKEEAKEEKSSEEE